MNWPEWFEQISHLLRMLKGRAEMDRLFLHNNEPRRAYVIAEIGGNFTTFEEAKNLVDAAYACGVDAVKLQTFRADTLASRNALFDMENTGVTSQYKLFRKYEIDEELHREIFSYIRSRGLDWFSTPSHETDVDLLESLGVRIYKIGSDDANNIPFLKYVAATMKPVILATGMCTMEEVREAVDTIQGCGNNRIALLHAVTSYPTHPEHVNLLAMDRMRREFGLPVGYSDHTLGTVACVAAAAMGAMVLEKHFTLDKNADGPDHMLSADPGEMKALVEQVRLVELMLGSGLKVPAESERVTRINNRKSLVANRTLAAGEVISPDSIGIKRPGHGIPPRYYEMVVGRCTTRALAIDETISWSDLR
jgi:N-acetylneuraminate synthase